jgi:hypothetical protein
MNDLSSNIAASDPTRIAGRLMQKAHNRDGLPEICAGVFLMVTAAGIFAPRILPHNKLGAAVLFVMLLVLMLTCFALPRAPKWLRKRFLLAQVGYVKPKAIPRRLKNYLGFAIGIPVALLVVYFAHDGRWLLAAAAILWGGITVTFGRSLRYWVTAVVAVSAGVWLAFTNIELGLGFAILWGGLGLVTLTSGSFVLLRFLRQSREDDESVSEEGAGE